ncbi:MAG: tetratricopeptide repeat protein [Puniceicoccales bacterium]|jgi:tetratricopeptide (TPR) repeat protein|nr:tetratricopeptide repeat protein [Puniceicoccales bacterium]
MSKSAQKKVTPEQTRSALLGLAFYQRKENGNWVLRPRLKVLAVVMLVLAIVVYFAAATTMYIFNRYHRECEETSYAEMMLYVIPNRIPFTKVVFMPEFLNKYIVNARMSQQEKLGRMVLAKARTPQDLMLAARLMPNNWEAQLRAAIIMLGPFVNRIDDAFSILDKTLENELQNTKFITQYIQICFMYDQDNRLINSAQKYLDDPRISAEAKNNLATSYAEALFLRGEFEKSNDVLEKYQLIQTLSGFLLKVQMIWENGEHERAINLIKGINKEVGGNDRLLYALAKFYWEEDRLDDAAQTLALIAILKPNDYKARIYMLPLLVGENNKVRREEAINAIIQQFGADENAMLAMGSYAADQGNYDLQLRINKLAIENRFKKLANFRLLLVETLLTGGRNPEALKDISELFTLNPPWLKDRMLQGQFEALRMLAYFSSNQNDLGVITFNKIVDNPEIPVQIAVSIARRLLRLNRPEEAKALLHNAYVRNHNNQGVLLELVKMDLKSESTATLGEHLGHLIAGRRPPRYVLEDAYNKLASDRYIFTPNRDKLIEDVTDMLKTRVLPANDIEKSWPTY